MTPLRCTCGRQDLTVPRAVYCGLHSDPDVGVLRFACGAPAPGCPVCPCETADRYLVVEAARASSRWWECADVLICSPQSGLSAASRVTRTALDRLPGCALAVASIGGFGRVLLRIGDDVVVVSGHPISPAWLAGYAHRHERGGDP